MCRTRRDQMRSGHRHQRLSAFKCRFGHGHEAGGKQESEGSSEQFSFHYWLL